MRDFYDSKAANFISEARDSAPRNKFNTQNTQNTHTIGGIAVVVRIAIMVMAAVALEAAMVAEIFDLITVSAFVMPSISTLALVLLFLLLVLTLKWVLALAHFVVRGLGVGGRPRLVGFAVIVFVKKGTIGTYSSYFVSSVLPFFYNRILAWVSECHLR